MSTSEFGAPSIRSLHLQIGASRTTIDLQIASAMSALWTNPSNVRRRADEIGFHVLRSASAMHEYRTSPYESFPPVATRTLSHRRFSGAYSTRPLTNDAAFM